MAKLIFPIFSGLIIIGLVVLIFKWLGKKERLAKMQQMEEALGLEDDEAFTLLMEKAKTLEEKEEILCFAKDKIAEAAPNAKKAEDPEPLAESDSYDESSFEIEEEAVFNAENALNAIEGEEEDYFTPDEDNLIWGDNEFFENKRTESKDPENTYTENTYTENEDSENNEEDINNSGEGNINKASDHLENPPPESTQELGKTRVIE